MKKYFILLLILLGNISFSQESYLINDYLNFYRKDTTFSIDYKYYKDSITNEVERHYEPYQVTIPRFRILTSKEDIIRFEKTQMNCVNWLLTTPINSDSTLRNEIESFVLDCPLVSLIINEDILKYLKCDEKYEKEIDKAYKLGIVKYLIEKTYEPDSSKIQLAGLMGLIDFYNTNKAINIKKSVIILDYEKNHDEKQLISFIKRYY